MHDLLIAPRNEWVNESGYIYEAVYTMTELPRHTLEAITTATSYVHNSGKILDKLYNLQFTDRSINQVIRLDTTLQAHLKSKPVIISQYHREASTLVIDSLDTI